MADAATYLMAQCLTLVALIGGTIEYIELIRRRAERRRLDLERAAAEASGLRGLVRVLLADEERAALPPLRARPAR